MSSNFRSRSPDDNIGDASIADMNCPKKPPKQVFISSKTMFLDYIGSYYNIESF
jgi:hypothetical protein